ncbi:MAG TPA: proton-conducting transporter membrane subunit, partial [Marinobacter sp.]|nr:proton-conducting transporter membrane subunit [Marinobacter sp.]
MSAYWWLIVPLAPLLAGLLLWRYPAQGRIAVALAPLPAILVACIPPPALALGWLWLPSLWGAEDWVSRILLGFTALLWLLAGLYAAADRHLRSRGFWLFWLLALTGNLLLIIAVDSASFYVGFTLMSLSAYGLIIHNASPEARQAGRLYIQLAIIGEMLLFAGLMLRIHEAGGELLFIQWREVPTGLLTSILILVGLGLKAGFWPLHIWLPYAHPAAPAAASAVLSGAMIKAGILGLWRFLPDTGPELEHAP